MNNQQLKEGGLFNMSTLEQFQEKINQRFPKEQLKVEAYEGARSYGAIRCMKCGKLYEYASVGGVLRKEKTCICHICQSKNKKFNSFSERLKQEYPKDSLQVICFTDRKEPCVIKCKTCGNEYSFKQAGYAFNKTRGVFCPKCFPGKNDLMQKTIKKFIDFIDKSDDWVLAQETDGIHSHTLVACRCLHCGDMNYKTVYDYMRGRGCFCLSGTRQKTTEEFEKELDDDYELLSEYKSAFNKVLLRHKTCGFAYSVTPHNYLTGKRCPRCSRFESKGERQVRKYLSERKIRYIKEFPVIIDGHKLRFDFYLPDFDIYIEYQGKQHYEPVEYFGGIEGFNRQVALDEKKRKYAKGKILEIPYNQEVSDILDNFFKFNDYPNEE